MQFIEIRCIYVCLFLACILIAYYYTVIKNGSDFLPVPFQLIPEQQDGNITLSTPSLNASTPLPSYAGEKYLLYTRGGDYCAGVKHYVWSLSCALGEAILLNRKFVLEDTFCVPAIHNDGKKLENNISLYLDVSTLKTHAKVIEMSQFRDVLNGLLQNKALYSFKNVPVSTPTSELRKVNSVVLTREFTTNQYGFQVCEKNKQIKRPWAAIWGFSPQIMEISWKICGELNWDFDAVHIRRGDKILDKKRWPNLEMDTKPPKLLRTLLRNIKPGRMLYIATNEKNLSLFQPLTKVFKVKFQQNFSRFWAKGSRWWNSTKTVFRNDSSEPYFDGAMKGMVDYVVLKKAKIKIETFNDLTSDPKNGRE